MSGGVLAPTGGIRLRLIGCLSDHGFARACFSVQTSARGPKRVFERLRGPFPIEPEEKTTLRYSLAPGLGRLYLGVEFFIPAVLATGFLPRVPLWEKRSVSSCRPRVSQPQPAPPTCVHVTTPHFLSLQHLFPCPSWAAVLCHSSAFTRPIHLIGAPIGLARE